MKLIQLNIEQDKHLDRIGPFLEREQPDVVCLEEVFERDLVRFATDLGMEYVFAPMILNAPHTGTPEFHIEGVGILSRIPIVESTVRWYFGDGEKIPIQNPDDRDTVHQPLITIDLDINGAQLCIGATHFMKSWHGVPDDYQRERMKRLLPVLDEAQPDILCGDFNIPRGTELYDVLAGRLHDNVPPEYVNSLDSALHRVPGLSLMVDYLWSSPRVHITHVRQVCGVSDHCAFVGEVRGATGA